MTLFVVNPAAAAVMFESSSVKLGGKQSEDKNA